MHFVNKAAFAAVALSGLMFASAASAAYGADANAVDCIRMSRQVATAIEAAQPGKAKEDAVAMQRAGRDFCAIARFEKGVNHYAKALTLLGQESKG